MQAEFVVLSGLPGSGKSTSVDWAFRSRGAWLPVDLEAAFASWGRGEECQDKDSVILSSDHLIEVWGDEDGLYYPEAWVRYHKDAEALFQRNLELAIDEGFDVIVDRTNLTRKSRHRMLSKLRQNKSTRDRYRTTLVALGFDLELALLRNSKRTLPNGSPKVTEDLIRKMAEHMQNPVDSEGYDRVVRTYDELVGTHFEHLGP